ncbi:hypothetical protein M431DRAFT_503620 [Trichoderma harzianum CBS 226.95]|uniref:Uncharacterized protein n=1 Tax=Trichoderma harzianum CBS 226.95 TaxID=983964 RepID=A0A2T4AP27_TRIHA|nr:hypothetical protein M431DRAFT_503620 [Trichoderma harzianum CBS 226.95]PTB58668.1 hypothetical protein M431DRAFT_503620 [Trichoderma harzianum CBS 226.95]
MAASPQVKSILRAPTSAPTQTQCEAWRANRPRQQSNWTLGETVQAPRQRQPARDGNGNSNRRTDRQTDHKQAAHVDAGTGPIHDVTVMRVCHLALHLGRGRLLGLRQAPICPACLCLSTTSLMDHPDAARSCWVGAKVVHAYSVPWNGAG